MRRDAMKQTVEPSAKDVFQALALLFTWNSAQPRLAKEFSENNIRN
jgi:hypothetical protein